MAPRAYPSRTSTRDGGRQPEPHIRCRHVAGLLSERGGQRRPQRSSDGYRRNSAARSLVTRRSQIIGVLGSELSQYGPANTLLGVERAARDAGYFVSVAALREVTRDAILDAVRHFLDQSVDGIVVIVPHLETLAALAELPIGVPVVAVGPDGNDTVGGVKVDQRRPSGVLSFQS